MRQADAALQRKFTRDIWVFESVARWHDEQEWREGEVMEDNSDMEEETAARQTSHTR